MKLFGMNIVDAILYSNFLCILNKETLILSRNLNFINHSHFVLLVLVYLFYGIFLLHTIYIYWVTQLSRLKHIVI